ncbi:MAG: YicC family protein [Treponema sp.]|nr:YicC family protein [Treponema sp.]
MNSMTGYAYKEDIVGTAQISVEIKSVNNRFLDLSVSLPSFLNPIEQKIRKTVSEKIARGKVDLAIRVRENQSNSKVTADLGAAKAYYDAIKSVAASLGAENFSGGGAIPLSLVTSQEGVLSLSRDVDADEYWNKIQPTFDAAVETFLADRAREGKNLKADLLKKLDVLDQCAAFFAQWQPQMEGKFKEQILSRFEELLGDKVDQNRVMAEVAALMVKYTINEEIVRLQSHLKAMRKEMEENPAPGKRLDFICQEANREINTIGSKNQFIEVGQKVIDAKDALENIREQSKNVE